MAALGKVAVDISLLQELQEQLTKSAKVIADQLSEPSEGYLSLADIAESPCSPRGLGPGIFDEKAKFQLQENGVPVLTTEAPKRHSMFSSKSTVSSQMTLEDGVELLDEWREKFVLSQQEAIEIYGEMHRVNQEGLGPVRKKRNSHVGLVLFNWKAPCGKDISTLKEGVRQWRLIWDFLTIVLVSVDAVALPLLLAWPALFPQHGFIDRLYEVTPAFWLLDIFVSVISALLSEQRIKMLVSYACSWFLFDVFLVTLDLVLLQQLVPDELKALTLLRLLRTAKFRHAISQLESQLESFGLIRMVSWSTILQCVVFILGVNHVLACVTFYVGRSEKELLRKNWIVENDVEPLNWTFQYMISFNWVISQYTPAPYPFAATNEAEQGLVLAIILTCLPMLGAQIGIISGTLNKMNEKAKEREVVRRELQRWLRKTRAKKTLCRRVLEALDEVMKSDENPLEVKEPLALDFLPSTLIQELHVVNTGDQLSIHPLLKVLMDERLEFGGQLASAFASKVYIHGESVFSEGRKAEGIYITTQGSFSFKANVQDGMAKPRQSLHRSGSWFAELALFMHRMHASTLTSTTYAKSLVMSQQAFVEAVQDWPGIVVAVHEYAHYMLRLFQRKAHFVEASWEIPPSSWPEEAVSTTQLAELLAPGTSHMHSFKQEEIETPVNFRKLLQEDHTLEDQIVEVQDQIREFHEDDGIYDALGCKDDMKRSKLAILCLGWFVRDRYESMVVPQERSTRLTRSTWKSIRELLFCEEMSFDELNCLVVLLGIRGICKSADFAKLVPPSERQRHEQVLAYAVENLQSYLPSLASIAEGSPESYADLSAVVEVLKEFNFAQFLQGENTPHSVWLLKSAQVREGTKVLKMCLLAQVCILSAVLGVNTVRGSMFLTEPNGRCLVKALHFLQQVVDLDSHSVYWRYIQSRAEALNLPVQTPANLVLARLACLTRCVEHNAAMQLQDYWFQLTKRERDVLLDVFLLDGHEQKTFMFVYLPLFLTNAKMNHDVGLLGALSFLVEVYDRLLKHRCLMLTGPSVNVDVSSLAFVVKDVEDLSTLRKCFDFAKIVKHENGVTILLTRASYEVLSGQLVHHTRSADMLEQLTQQQLRLESAIMALPMAKHRPSQHYSSEGASVEGGVPGERDLLWRI